MRSILALVEEQGCTLSQLCQLIAEIRGAPAIVLPAPMPLSVAALTFRSALDGTYTIYVDQERYAVPRAVVYAASHEIGHIVLGHVDHVQLRHPKEILKQVEEGYINHSVLYEQKPTSTQKYILTHYNIAHEREAEVIAVALLPYIVTDSEFVYTDYSLPWTSPKHGWPFEGVIDKLRKRVQLDKGFHRA